MRRMLGIVAVLAVLACDPIMGVQGEVRSIPVRTAAEADVYASGRPIEGATATYRCGSDRHVLATTDENGHFSWGTVGLLDANCDIVIQKAGYEAQTFSVGDYCGTTNSESTCHFVAVLAELVPKTPMSTRVDDEKPRHGVEIPVEFTVSPARAEIFVQTGDIHGLVAYDPIHGKARLPAGEHRLAAAIDGRDPVAAEAPLNLTRPVRVDLTYVDRSTERVWRSVALLSGVVVGSTLMALSATTDDTTADVALIGSGAVVMFAGTLVGLGNDTAQDRVEMQKVDAPNEPARSSDGSGSPRRGDTPRPPQER